MNEFIFWLAVLSGTAGLSYTLTKVNILEARLKRLEEVNDRRAES